MNYTVDLQHLGCAISGSASGQRPEVLRRAGAPLQRPLDLLPAAHSAEITMIVLGIILLIVGLLAHISIIETIGIVLVVIGVVLFILGSMGRPVGGHRHYW